MITKVDSVILTCDNCEAVYHSSGSDFSIFADLTAAIENATDDDWLAIDDKHYCPDCHPINKGDYVLIKDNLRTELERMGFTNPDAGSHLVGTVQTAYDVYESDKDQFDGKSEWFVTVDLCMEIPIAACELVK